MQKHDYSKNAFSIEKMAVKTRLLLSTMPLLSVKRAHDGIYDQKFHVTSYTITPLGLDNNIHNRTAISEQHF